MFLPTLHLSTLTCTPGFQGNKVLNLCDSSKYTLDYNMIMCCFNILMILFQKSPKGNKLAFETQISHSLCAHCPASVLIEQVNMQRIFSA
jgi:hypothetical protein